MNTLNLETAVTAAPPRPLADLLTDLRQAGVQVWMEGDRLRYKAPKGALTPVLMEELRDRKLDIITFLKTVAAETDPVPTITQVDRQQPLPLSFTQERFWSLAQLHPQSPGFNMPMAYRFTGQLDRAVLEQSLARILQRHEILRTTFVTDGEQVCQRIAAHLSLPLEWIDLTHVPPEDREAVAQDRANQLAKLPFDLAQGPLVQFHLLVLEADNHIILWNFHSIICDGTSLDRFFQEFVALYTAFAQGQPDPLPPLTIQYADFAHWQRQQLQGETLERLLDYWQSQSQKLPVLPLPTDRPRPLQPSNQGDRCARLLPKALNDGLNKVSQGAGTTLFMTLLAAFKVLLYRYSGQTDLVVNAAIANRQQSGVDTMLGYLRNTLILRTSLEGSHPEVVPSFRDILERVRQVSLAAYQHQDLPFERLVEDLRPDGVRGGAPLFQAAFALNPPWKGNQGITSQCELPGVTLGSLFGYVYIGTTSYDLSLTMRETDQGLRLVFVYNTHLFDQITIQHLIDQFQALLEGIVANPDHPIDRLPLMSTATQQQMLADWPEAVVLDTHHQFLPTGIPGQVYLTEQGRSQGILPVTAASTLTYPISPDQSAIALYPTGQTGRRHGNGTLILDADRVAEQPQRSAPVAPRDGLEQQLVELWEATLGIHPIGIRDNFFELGGYSLLAIRLFADIQSRFDQDLPPNLLFQAPTVEALAQVLRQKDWTPTWTSLVPIQPQGTRPPLFFHGGAADALTWANVARQLGHDQPFYALERPDLNGPPLEDDSVEAIAALALEDIRQIQPHGPYHLAGHCFGGMVMVEVAQRLRAEGETVALLTLVDAYAPEAIVPQLKLPAPLLQLYCQCDRAIFWFKKTYHYYLRVQGWGQFTQQWLTLWKRAQQKAQFARQKQQAYSQYQTQSPTSSSKREAELPDLPYEVRYALAEEACRSARQAYVPQPYPDPVVILRPSTILENWRYGRLQGWDSGLTGQVTLKIIPGLTGNLFNQAALPHLVKALSSYLS
ncbi:alpha/beta fold hydrolase [Leptolyngbya sp. PCC 6406]|uniref:alpha/beta fold hydrolase n=1 Tax=Leptolyngbya sp. PCC 6406 TaxID=1173264 RepID=UPI0002ABE37D|nr:alpha/beta fold hydrolase [Leptolyngbya sp. PCC 6406]